MAIDQSGGAETPVPSSVRVTESRATSVSGRPAPLSGRPSLVHRCVALVAKNSLVRKAVMTTPLARDVAWRFVAGEDLEAGLAAVRVLNSRGIKATLNCVGTHVRLQREAVAAADSAIEALRRIRELGLDSNVSVKLTQIGLDVDEGLCRAELRRVLDAATELESFVRIDMEESSYVKRTLDIFDDMLRAYGPDRVGIVLQSYLRDRRSDIARLTAVGARIRLVKGGYWEPAGTAFRTKSEIDRAFMADIDHLLRHGHQPAIATHDQNAIERVKRIAAEMGLAADRYEIQMLFGVERDLQTRLVRDGWTVRCYVPYGGLWYEYVLGCLRRLPGGIVQRARGRIVRLSL